MRKLAILLGLGGAVGFASLAMAQPGTVTIQCTTFASTTGQTIFGIDKNSTVTLPATCTPGASCAQCIKDLRSMTPAFSSFGPVNVDAASGYAGAYYLLVRF